MNNKILISPYSAKLRSGQTNPKNYPYWNILVELLDHAGYEVIQIGISGEDRIEGVSQFVQGWPFDKMKQLVNDCATWVSIDSWLPHFCHCERLKRGIVLFGQSDPRIFGYSENVNLLRGRDFLRQFQYDCWDAATYNPQAFVYAENVMPHVYKLAPLPPGELLLTADVPVTLVKSA